MLDIKMIRQNVDEVKEQLGNRGVKPEIIDEIVSKDRKRRDIIVQTETLKKQRNDVSQAIAQLKRNKENADTQIEEMKKVGDAIKAFDEELNGLDEEVTDMASRLPNMPNKTIPVGPDEDSNVELRKVGTPRTFDFEPKAHWEIGEKLDILDFERGAKVAGSRFLYYKGWGARLERALYNFMLDEHAADGYTEIIPPYVVNDESMYGTGQFPKFKGTFSKLKMKI